MIWHALLIAISGYLMLIQEMITYMEKGRYAAAVDQTYFQLSSASHLMNLAHSMITVFLCGILRTTLQLTLWKLLGTQLINRILLHTQPACWSCWLCVAAICMDEELVSTTDDINLHVCDPPNVFFKDWRIPHLVSLSQVLDLQVWASVTMH